MKQWRTCHNIEPQIGLVKGQKIPMYSSFFVFVFFFYRETSILKQEAICRLKMRGSSKFSLVHVICRRVEAADYFRKF